MICARGRTSHSTRNTTRIASCAPRTVRRLRRSRRSHARYCGLGAAIAGDSSAFDMDFELLPERVEVAVELRRVARRERRRARAVRGWRNGSRWSDFTRPGRRDSTMTRSAMLTASPMSWVTRIAVLPSRRRISVTSSASAIRVCESSAENGSSSSTTSGSVQSVRASATRWRMPPESWRGRWCRNWPSP